MRPTRRSLLAAAGVASLASAIPAYAKAPKTVVARTVHGPVRGAVESSISVFRGVRYGADTATTRFAKSVAPAAWTKAAPALEYGRASPQGGSEANQSEDCLFLNVWTPGVADGGKRPVMVYFHGGAYASGSGSSTLYDGARLAAKGDVVVVTVNHRLNAFGYLYLDRLMPGAFPDSGNAGQWDLVLALQWVRDNAAAFGGDPGRVMVFGQSGGGAKIATLMASPSAAGLFHSAATMSGQQVTASGPLNATRRAEAFLAALGVGRGDAAVMRALPVQKIIDALGTADPLDASQGLYFGPVFDNRMLHRHPFWPDAPAQSAAIPMVLGNTRDETRNLIGRREPESFTLTWEEVPARLARHMRCDINPDFVVRTYRDAFPAMTPSEVFFAATTAGRSWRGQVEEADARAKAGGPTWVYQFDLPSPDDGGKWRAPHTIDIAHAFDNLDKPGAMSGTGETAQRVADQLSRAFIALARNGDPNHAGLPSWSRHTLPSRETMVFDTETRLVNDPRKVERELFAQVPFIQWGS